MAMARLLPIAFSVAWLGAVCGAERTNSSNLAKLHDGVSQVQQMLMHRFVGGEDVQRTPKKIKLALVYFGRTGTTSFSAALKELGYTPLHDDEFYGDVLIDLFHDFFSGQRSVTSVDEFLGEIGKQGFDATPALILPGLVEWSATAPDVKVILLTRETKKWAQSWLIITPFTWIFKCRPFTFFKSTQVFAMVLDNLANVLTKGRPELYEDVPTLEAGFDAWTEFVKKTVPSERLLVFSVKQGWGPLCEFLGLPTPSVPFPHLNEGAVIKVAVWVFAALTWIWPLVLASPLLLLMCCCRCCCGRRKQVDDSSTAKKRQ